MSRPIQDARLQEMQFLSRVLREGTITATGLDQISERSMIISLFQDGYLNGLESVPWDREDVNFIPWHGNMINPIMDEFERRHWNDIAKLLSGRGNVEMQISHKGRVRLSELEQQLTSSRDRDRFGILWTGRHLDTDLTIAFLSASKESPIAIAYLDMNGLKPINDTYGHAAADEVIRSYLGTVAIAVGGLGEAYRVYDGGDEVVVIMRSTNAESARKLMHGLLQQLSKEKVTLPDATTPTLTASCGIETTANPNENGPEFLDRADKTMKRAKELSKRHDPRVSVLAVGEEEPVIVMLPPAP